jgi:limonene-1,2-epoxide hydrolase
MNATSMSRDDRDLATVRDFLRAMEDLDVDRVSSLLADDVVYQNVPLPPDRGREPTMRTLQRLGRVFTNIELRVHNIAARDGVVLTERTDVLSGRLFHLELWVCGTFEVRDGRITLWRDYFDWAQVVWGMVLSPWRLARARLTAAR